MKTAPLFLALLFLLPALRVEESRPNVLLILADDLGYGDVQCLNPERGRIPTPHLDRLAAEGRIFTDAHSGSSVCTPTRYGLLTGRYAWRTRLQSGVLDGGNDEPLIAEDRLTLGSFFQSHGYHTACLGKWHLGFQSEAAPGGKKAGKGFGKAGLPPGATISGGPETRGFDRFEGCSNARTMGSWIEGDRVAASVEPIDVLPRLAERAVAHLEARAKAGGPFFLYLPLTSPHTPILPTAEWQGKSGLGDYGDFVMMTDAVVGEVLDALKRNGLSESTLVIFSSDNGCSPQAGTKELEAQGHYASERYRGYKSDIWDGGHRVPFLARWPGRIPAGSQSDRLLCLTDVFATCAELLGETLPDDAAEDSFSFLPSLLGKADPAPRPPVVHHSIQGRFAIRDEHWKLSFCAGSGGWSKPGDKEAEKAGLPRWQLHDLAADPGEKRNLLDEKPEVAQRLAELLRGQIDLGRSTPGSEAKNDVKVRSPFAGNEDR